MARSLSDATPSEGGPKKRGGKIIEAVDFSAEVYTEFKDGADALTDAFDSYRMEYTKKMGELYADAHVKTGVPTAVTKALFTEHRRLGKAAKRAREFEKPQIQALETIARDMLGTPMGDIAKKMLDDAKAILN